MLRFGKISQYDPVRGYARVKFDDIGIVSDFLPVLSNSTKTVISEFPISNENQVACLMDDQCNAGVILGAVFSDDVKPTAASEDKFQVKFDDGLIITYDKAAKKLTLAISNTQLIMDANGWTMKLGGESIDKIIGDLIDQTKAITDKVELLTVTCAGPGNPSGVPVNIADFVSIGVNLTSIKNRLPNLFEG